MTEKFVMKQTEEELSSERDVTPPPFDVIARSINFLCYSPPLVSPSFGSDENFPSERTLSLSFQQFSLSSHANGDGSHMSECGGRV